MGFVAGFGNTNVDLLFGGMARVPQEGEEIYSESFSMQLGGGVPATLINLGRLGVPCKIQTFLGKDVFSDFALKQYQANGVEPLTLQTESEIPVNLTCAAVTAKDRAFTSYSSGNAVTERELAEVYDASKGADIVLMDREFLPIYGELKKNGSLLVYDVGWSDNMSLESMEEILQLADYYTPNAREALKITGAATIPDALKMLNRYLEYPLVKLDKDGCCFLENGKINEIPPWPGTVCVDTTGAGDAFLAGFVYGLYHHCPVESCVEFGNITGAACVTQLGCLKGFVTEEELLLRSAVLHEIKASDKSTLEGGICV